MKETESNSPTPEQLIRILDAEIATKRSQREKSGRNRATILVVGILIIVTGAGAALLILDQMVADLRRGEPIPAVTPHP